MLREHTTGLRELKKGYHRRSDSLSQTRCETRWLCHKATMPCLYTSAPGAGRQWPDPFFSASTGVLCLPAVTLPMAARKHLSARGGCLAALPFPQAFAAHQLHQESARSLFNRAGKNESLLQLRPQAQWVKQATHPARTAIPVCHTAPPRAQERPESQGADQQRTSRRALHL